jgi:hypothetical protein
MKTYKKKSPQPRPETPKKTRSILGGKKHSKNLEKQKIIKLKIIKPGNFNI